MDATRAPVEVFADVGCPFTHVGLRRFVDRRRVAGRGDVLLHVRAWPLEVVNGHPLDPAMIAAEVDALRTTVAPDLFVGFDPARFPSTSRPAFALAAAAYRRDTATGEAVSLDLRTRLFEQGEDIAAPEVLADVERAFELEVGDDDVASIERDRREGAARGVVGSPHFFTPHGSFFCPSLDISHDEQAGFRVAFDESGFEELLAAALA